MFDAEKEREIKQEIETVFTLVFHQMSSLMVQLDNITNTIQLVKKPNGHRQFPARSCCDLKHDYPNARTGQILNVYNIA